MKKNKLYAIIGSLVILSSFSLVSCGKENSPSNDVGGVTHEEVSKDDNEEKTTEAESIATREEESQESDKEETTNKEETSKADKDKKDKEEVTTDKTEEKTTKEKETTDSKEAIIEEKKKVINNNNLKYPEFKNINNAKDANALVEEFVLKISNSYEHLNMNYKIMYQNEDFISIYFEGETKSPDLAYPSKFKTTLNVNIGAGTPLRLSNLVSFDEEFINKFKEKLVSKCSEIGFEASTVFDLDNLSDLLNKSDNNNNNLSDVQSYYDGKQLNVILSVPHALGDYIEIAI